MSELYLSKLLPLFVYPLGFTLTAGVVALLLGAAGKRILAMMLMTIALAVLWLSATPWFSDMLMGDLEARYPPVAIKAVPKAEAIVLLGGGLNGVKPPRLTADLDIAADRVLYAARLYRAGKAPRVLVSGGSLPWQALPPESEAMYSLLVELGVPDEAIISESASRNTRENAQFSKALLDSRKISRILLVTSAYHMPRAAAIFRQTGLQVTPAATDYRVVKRPRTLFDYLPDSRALHQTTQVVKEYIGLQYHGVRVD